MNQINCIGIFPNNFSTNIPINKYVHIHLDEKLIKTKFIQEVVSESNGIPLESAKVVVAGGRGLGDAKNFDLLRELAEVLGGAVGASRAVCDAGWLDHSLQIGSSGQVVSPKLYLALGISGAIQHVVGMKGSGCILVINKDKNAPIFEIADYGVVGDIMEIVPKLNSALQEVSG